MSTLKNNINVTREIKYHSEVIRTLEQFRNQTSYKLNRDIFDSHPETCEQVAQKLRMYSDKHVKVLANCKKITKDVYDLTVELVEKS